MQSYYIIIGDISSKYSFDKKMNKQKSKQGQIKGAFVREKTSIYETNSEKQNIASWNGKSIYIYTIAKQGDLAREGEEIHTV